MLPGRSVEEQREGHAPDPGCVSLRESDTCDAPGRVPDRGRIRGRVRPGPSGAMTGEPGKTNRPRPPAVRGRFRARGGIVLSLMFEFQMCYGSWPVRVRSSEGLRHVGCDGSSSGDRMHSRRRVTRATTSSSTNQRLAVTHLAGRHGGAGRRCEHRSSRSPHRPRSPQDRRSSDEIQWSISAGAFNRQSRPRNPQQLTARGAGTGVGRRFFDGHAVTVWRSPNWNRSVSDRLRGIRGGVTRLRTRLRGRGDG